MNTMLPATLPWFTYHGTIDDLAAYIRKCIPVGYRNVLIFARKVSIKSDVECPSTYSASQVPFDLTVVCEELEVSGSYSIDFSGKKAYNLLSFHDTKTGTALDGKAGCDGGSFTIYAVSKTGKGKLSINLNGGNGGKAQCGYIGKPGAKAEDTPWYNPFTTNDGKPGESGGDGGRGGKGGNAGELDVVMVMNDPNELVDMAYTNGGEGGEGGDEGKGGVGGVGGGWWWGEVSQGNKGKDGSDGKSGPTGEKGISLKPEFSSVSDRTSFCQRLPLTAVFLQRSVNTEKLRVIHAKYLNDNDYLQDAKKNIAWMSEIAVSNSYEVVQRHCTEVAKLVDQQIKFCEDPFKVSKSKLQDHFEDIKEVANQSCGIDPKQLRLKMQSDALLRKHAKHARLFNHLDKQFSHNRARYDSIRDIASNIKGVPTIEKDVDTNLHTDFPQHICDKMAAAAKQKLSPNVDSSQPGEHLQMLTAVDNGSSASNTTTSNSKAFLMAFQTFGGKGGTISQRSKGGARRGPQTRPSRGNPRANRPPADQGPKRQGPNNNRGPRNREKPGNRRPDGNRTKPNNGRGSKDTPQTDPKSADDPVPKDPNTEPNKPKDLKPPPEEPETIPKGPEVVPKEPETIPKGPETIPKGPEVVPKEPETIPKGPETIPEGPETVPKGPETLPEVAEPIEVEVPEVLEGGVAEGLAAGVGEEAAVEGGLVAILGAEAVVAPELLVVEAVGAVLIFAAVEAISWMIQANVEAIEKYEAAVRERVQLEKENRLKLKHDKRVPDPPRRRKRKRKQRSESGKFIGVLDKCETAYGEESGQVVATFDCIHLEFTTSDDKHEVDLTKLDDVQQVEFADQLALQRSPFSLLPGFVITTVTAAMEGKVSPNTVGQWFEFDCEFEGTGKSVAEEITPLLSFVQNKLFQTVTAVSNSKIPVTLETIKPLGALQDEVTLELGLSPVQEPGIEGFSSDSVPLSASDRDKTASDQMTAATNILSKISRVISTAVDSQGKTKSSGKSDPSTTTLAIDAASKVISGIRELASQSTKSQSKQIPSKSLKHDPDSAMKAAAIDAVSKAVGSVGDIVSTALSTNQPESQHNTSDHTDGPMAERTGPTQFSVTAPRISTIDSVMVANVGQGNCNILLDGDTALLAFDAGCSSMPDVKILIVLLETPVFIVSHWDLDHYNLLHHFQEELLEGKHLIAPSFGSTRGPSVRKVYYGCKTTVRNTGGSYFAVRTIGESIECPTPISNLDLRVTELPVSESKNKNNVGAITACITDKQGKPVFLLPGDATYSYIPTAQKADKKGNPSLRYLVASHHGSVRSYAEQFGGVDSIPPVAQNESGTVIFSYGINNSYGHSVDSAGPDYDKRQWTNQFTTAEPGVDVGIYTDISQGQTTKV